MGKEGRTPSPATPRGCTPFPGPPLAGDLAGTPPPRAPEASGPGRGAGRCGGWAQPPGPPQRPTPPAAGPASHPQPGRLPPHTHSLYPCTKRAPASSRLQARRPSAPLTRSTGPVLYALSLDPRPRSQPDRLSWPRPQWVSANQEAAAARGGGSGWKQAVGGGACVRVVGGVSWEASRIGCGGGSTSSGFVRRVCARASEHVWGVMQGHLWPLGVWAAPGLCLR